MALPWQRQNHHQPIPLPFVCPRVKSSNIYVHAICFITIGKLDTCVTGAWGFNVERERKERQVDKAA